MNISELFGNLEQAFGKTMNSPLTPLAFALLRQGETTPHPRDFYNDLYKFSDLQSNNMNDAMRRDLLGQQIEKMKRQEGALQKIEEIVPQFRTAAVPEKTEFNNPLWIQEQTGTPPSMMDYSTKTTPGQPAAFNREAFLSEALPYLMQANPYGTINNLTATPRQQIVYGYDEYGNKVPGLWQEDGTFTQIGRSGPAQKPGASGYGKKPWYTDPDIAGTPEAEAARKKAERIPAGKGPSVSKNGKQTETDRMNAKIYAARQQVAEMSAAGFTEDQMMGDENMQKILDLARTRYSGVGVNDPEWMDYKRKIQGIKLIKR